ncbi:hypothetical protein DTO271G3_3843 [Paecilomyces variotii]|nr:hypothetical protein DTO271G3_3843 [Paecilomyces variotii]
MKFFAMIIALAASTASVTAAPLSTEENELEARSCPNGWSECGTCDGTGCRIAGITWNCDVGSCTVQSGGGDGKPCGGGLLETIYCPGK